MTTAEEKRNNVRKALEKKINLAVGLGVRIKEQVENINSGHYISDDEELIENMILRSLHQEKQGVIKDIVDSTMYFYDGYIENITKENEEND